MFDAHIRSWKRHLKALEMKAIIAAVDLVRTEWRDKWATVASRNEGRKWLT